MSTVDVTDDAVEVRLALWEKIAALHGDLRVPRSAVTAAQVVPDGLAALRGLRAPGLGVPGVVSVGTWRTRGTRSFVAVRRGRPALRLTVTGQRFDSILVSCLDTEALAAALDPAARR